MFAIPRAITVIFIFFFYGYNRYSRDVSATDSICDQQYRYAFRAFKERFYLLFFFSLFVLFSHTKSTADNIPETSRRRWLGSVGLGIRYTLLLYDLSRRCRFSPGFSLFAALLPLCRRKKKKKKIRNRLHRTRIKRLVRPGSGSVFDTSSTFRYDQYTRFSKREGGRRH